MKPKRLPLVVDAVAFSKFIHHFQIHEVERLRERMSSDSDSYVKAGVLHWRSNDTVVSPQVYKDACLVCPEVQTKARDRYVNQKLREFRKPTVVTYWGDDVDAEMHYEMDAAFGVGSPVVNILTGRRIR